MRTAVALVPLLATATPGTANSVQPPQLNERRLLLGSVTSSHTPTTTVRLTMGEGCDLTTTTDSTGRFAVDAPLSCCGPATIQTAEPKPFKAVLDPIDCGVTITCHLASVI